MRSSAYGSVFTKCLLIVALLVFGTIASEGLPSLDRVYSLIVLGTYAVSIAIERRSLIFVRIFFLLTVIGAISIINDFFVPKAIYPVVLSSWFCALQYTAYRKSFKKEP